MVVGGVYGQTVELSPQEREFQESMTNVVLEGQSTRDGKEGVSPDRYNIVKVAKTGEDLWTFYVQTTYQGHEMTMPLPIAVKWAGDTPVITVTDKGFPGMGTYTARVVVYRGHYAGTWSGKDGGGKVFGRVMKK
jgi:hypothetical protein